MKICYLTFLFLACFSLKAFSQKQADDSNDYKYYIDGHKHYRDPKTPEQIKWFKGELCWNVGQAVPNKDKGSPYAYVYEQQMYEAAGADPDKDDDAEINRKIRVFWKSLGTCQCNSSAFDVVDGSLLKWAVSRTITDFIMDMLSWGIDLNDTLDDKDNNRTLLDYVQAQLIRNHGGPLEDRYQLYFRVLREHGAKFKSEL